MFNKKLIFIIAKYPVFLITFLPNADDNINIFKFILTIKQYMVIDFFKKN